MILDDEATRSPWCHGARLRRVVHPSVALALE